MTEMLPVRQGDVLLVPIDRDDVLLVNYERKANRHRKIKGLVLAEGEATGHHHVVVQDGPTTARIRTASMGGTMVRVLTVPESGAELVHDEHDTIPLPAGAYLIQGQREFVPPAPSERRSQNSTRRVWD